MLSFLSCLEFDYHKNPTRMADDSEVKIREVEDARASLRAVKKNPNAAWVEGLKPEEKPVSKPPPIVSHSMWLRTTVMLFSLAILTLLLSNFQIGLHRLAEVDFPESEAFGTAIVKPLDLVSRGLVCLPHLFTHIATIQFALKIAANFPVRFSLFVGVGIAALGVLATIGDAFMIIMLCSQAEKECFLPLVMHWICACLKWSCPIITCFITLLFIDFNVKDKSLWSRTCMLTYGFGVLLVGIAVWIGLGYLRWRPSADGWAWLVCSIVASYALIATRLRLVRQFKWVVVSEDKNK